MCLRERERERENEREGKRETEKKTETERESEREREREREREKERLRMSRNSMWFIEQEERNFLLKKWEKYQIEKSEKKRYQYQEKYRVWESESQRRRELRKWDQVEERFKKIKNKQGENVIEKYRRRELWDQEKQVRDNKVRETARQKQLKREKLRKIIKR